MLKGFSYIVQAYQHLGETNIPKFTVIVAQKNHHTKLFQANASENVPPGPCPTCSLMSTYSFILTHCLLLSSLSRDSSGQKNCASKKLRLLYVHTCRNACKQSHFHFSLEYLVPAFESQFFIWLKRVMQRYRHLVFLPLYIAVYIKILKN